MAYCAVFGHLPSYFLALPLLFFLVLGRNAFVKKLQPWKQCWNEHAAMGSCLNCSTSSDEFWNSASVLTLLSRFKGHSSATRKGFLVWALNLNMGVVGPCHGCLQYRSKIRLQSRKIYREGWKIGARAESSSGGLSFSLALLFCDKY